MLSTICRRLAPIVCLPLLALPACSPPEPALTAAEFYDQAEAIQHEAFGSGENAWPRLLDALAAHREALNTADAQINTDTADPDAWPSIQIDEVRLGPYPRGGLDNARLALKEVRSRGVLDEIDAVLAAPVLCRPWDRTLPVNEAFGADLDAGGQIRALARTNLALLRIAAVDDTGEDVAAIVDRHLGLARAAASRLLYIDYLVGVANVLGVLTEIKSLALEGELTAEECRALLERLDERILPPLRAVLDTERLFALASSADAAMAADVDPGELVAAIDACHAEAVAWIDQPYGASFEVASLGEFIMAAIAEDTSNGGLIDNMRSAAGQIIRNAKVLDLQIAATRVVLMLELHRLEHGSYPDSLDALEREVPADPVTGGQVVYRLTPGEPLPYTLYSTGTDDKDDGGIEKPQTGMSFPDPGDEGYDFLLVKLRRPAPRE